MAESIARQLASDVIEPSSAGLYPLGHITRTTEQTLLSNGYPVRGLSSKALGRCAIEKADVIINMSDRSLDNHLGRGQSFSVEEWKVEDPHGEKPAAHQRVLKELESRVLLLAARLRSRRQAASA
jgi:protein-tyrosine-phosphatase